MDVLLGEDETRPINRIALICTHCRLVNGQAPPGVKRLEEVGRWRCSECQQWNGKENEVQRILQDVKGTVASRVKPEVEPSKDTKREEMGEKSRVRRSLDGTEDENDVFTDRERSPTPASALPSTENDEDEDEDEVELDDDDENTPPPAKSTRSQAKAGRK